MESFSLLDSYNLYCFVCPGSCGGNFTATSGHMSSPSYPNFYPGGSHCNYVISQPPGTIILLNFHSMDIYTTTSSSSSCVGDYLEIRDGPLETSYLLIKLCGYEIPAPIQSSQNQVHIM